MVGGGRRHIISLSRCLFFFPCVMDDRYFLACLLDRQNILRIGFAWESDSSRLRLHLLLSGNELSTLYADLILCTNTTAIGKYDFCSAPITVLHLSVTQVVLQQGLRQVPLLCWFDLFSNAVTFHEEMLQCQSRNVEWMNVEIWCTLLYQCLLSVSDILSLARRNVLK